MSPLTCALIILLIVLCIYYAFIAKSEDTEEHLPPGRKRIQFEYRVSGGIDGRDKGMTVYDDFSVKLYNNHKTPKYMRSHLDKPEIIAVRTLKEWAFIAKNHYESPQGGKIFDGIFREFTANGRTIKIDPMANISEKMENALTVLDNFLV